MKVLIEIVSHLLQLAFLTPSSSPNVINFLFLWTMMITIGTTDWAHLENFTRQLTNSFSDLYVYTIPLYLPKLDPITKKNVVTYEVIGRSNPTQSSPTKTLTHHTKSNHCIKQQNR